MFFQTCSVQVRSVIRSRNQLLFVSNKIKYYHHLGFWCNVGLFGAMNRDYFLVTQVHFLDSHKCLMCSVLTTIIIFLNTIINHMIHHSNHPAIVHQLLNNQTVVFQVFCSHHCAYDTSTDSSYVCCLYQEGVFVTWSKKIWYSIFLSKAYFAVWTAFRKGINLFNSWCSCFFIFYFFHCNNIRPP